MKSLIDSIRFQVYERLNSPLFGAFALSWAGWNYRFIFVLFFSDLKVVDKFNYIDSVLYSTKWSLWSFCLVYPAVTASVFILVYPIVSRGFYSYWLKRQREQKEMRDKIEDAILLTQEESRDIRLQMIKVEESYKETISRLSKENDLLRGRQNEHERLVEEHKATQATKTELEGQLLSLRDELKNLREGLAKTETVSETLSKNSTFVEKGTLALVEMLAKRNGSMDRELIYQEFATQFKDAKVRVDFYIDGATKQNWIRTDFVKGASKVSLSEGGRRLAVEHKFI